MQIIQHKPVEYHIVKIIYDRIKSGTWIVVGIMSELAEWKQNTLPPWHTGTPFQIKAGI